jgi:hypothetical protein
LEELGQGQERKCTKRNKFFHAKELKLRRWLGGNEDQIIAAGHSPVDEHKPKTKFE